VSYAESQQLLEQERLGMTISLKTIYNLLRRQPGDSSNPSIIDGPLAALYESDFVYRTRTKNELKEDRVVNRELVDIVFCIHLWLRYNGHASYFCYLCRRQIATPHSQSCEGDVGLGGCCQ
jgi:hypothetical protein